MVEMYAHFPVVMWIMDGLIWALGVFFWILTYIVAPLESRKRVSCFWTAGNGFPQRAFSILYVCCREY